MKSSDLSCRGHIRTPIQYQLICHSWIWGSSSIHPIWTSCPSSVQTLLRWCDLTQNRVALCVCVCARHRPQVQHTEAQPHAWTWPAVPVSSPVYKTTKVLCPVQRERRTPPVISVPLCYLQYVNTFCCKSAATELSSTLTVTHTSEKPFGEWRHRTCGCPWMERVVFKFGSWLSIFTVLDLLATWLLFKHRCRLSS